MEPVSSVSNLDMFVIVWNSHRLNEAPFAIIVIIMEVFTNLRQYIQQLSLLINLAQSNKSFAG